MHSENLRKRSKKLGKERFRAKLLRDSTGLRQKRFPVSSPTDRNIDFWSSVWGKLIVKLASIENGPSIDSRDGKLFRRRFRVPWQVYCDLVLKCKDKQLFGERSLLKYDICGGAICGGASER